MVYLLCYHIVYQSEANANRPIPSNSVNIVNPIINHTPFDQMFQLHPKKSRGYQIMLFITKAITWIITTWCLYCKFINIWISILKLTPQSNTLLGGASHLVNGSKKHLCIYIYIWNIAYTIRGARTSKYGGQLVRHTKLLKRCQRDLFTAVACRHGPIDAFIPRCCRCCSSRTNFSIYPRNGKSPTNGSPVWKLSINREFSWKMIYKTVGFPHLC